MNHFLRSASRPLGHKRTITGLLSSAVLIAAMSLGAEGAVTAATSISSDNAVPADQAGGDDESVTMEVRVVVPERTSIPTDTSTPTDNPTTRSTPEPSQTISPSMPGGPGNGPLAESGVPMEVTVVGALAALVVVAGLGIWLGTRRRQSLRG